MSTSEMMTMRFTDERAEFERELDDYYSTYPTDISEIEAEVDRISDEHPDWGPCRRKAIIYQVAAERCPVKVFRHYPFFFELDTGLDRYRWGSHSPRCEGIGAWMYRQPEQQKLQEWAAEQKCDWEMGFCHGPAVFDYDHHCVGFDNVLQKGLAGIIGQARKRLQDPDLDEKQRDFLEATIIGNNAVLRIAERFAERAEAMARREDDDGIRRRLMRIAVAARRVPARAARTFYEACAVIMFMRHILGGLEGLGESIYGHLDRMLQPYLEADLADGTITRDEAEDLLRFFLAMTDVKCNICEEPRETSTTVMIGGCDCDGEPVFNDVTRMIIDAYAELDLVNPKLNARISSRHPDEYFHRLAELNAEGRNVTAIFNDDVVIEANVRMGKAPEDARLYVGGGCQENVLQNTEINSRASIYLNLAQVLLMGFRPEGWKNYTEMAGITLHPYAGATSFQEVRERFLYNLRAVADREISLRNATEKEGWWYNPCPAHSSTMDDCIENARDMLDGGTRYAGASVSLIGTGTVIDSLRAIDQLVFREKQVSLQELAELLETDFDGAEDLRLRAVNQVPKFGTDEPGAAGFAADVIADLARVTSGRPNTRGGLYEASMFVYRAFRGQGAKTGATPDGRRAGEALSPGMSPGPEGMRRSGGVTAVLGALEPIDLTDYPVVAVLDVKLPWTTGGCKPEVVEAMIRRFLDAGGSVVQFNVVDPQVLQDARKHPERHGDLVVRVSGYSARFTTLNESIQDEIIERELMKR
jgi:formate C-acetyltransferase